MAENKPKIATYKLTRVEDLSNEERNKVDGLREEVKEGLVIKEYRPGSFVKLRRFMPEGKLFSSQISKGLTSDARKKISEGIQRNLKF